MTLLSQETSTTTTAATPLQQAIALAGVFESRAPALDDAAVFPHQNFADLHRAGLLGLPAPSALGGRDIGLAEAIDIVRAIGRGEPSTALILAMQYINLHSIGRAGWPDGLARQTLARAVADGGLINALYVEPDLGTPVRGGLPDTTARRTDQGWSLTGRKIYATGSHGLSWLLVWARTDEAPPRVGQFLVPHPAAGVRIEATWNHLGMRATASHDMVFEDVHIPLDHAVDVRLPKDWAVVVPALRLWGAALVCAVYLGVADAAREWALQFLHHRKPGNLGAALATVPRLQEAAGRIDQHRMLATRLLRSVADDLARGHQPALAEIGLLKVAATEACIGAVEEAVGLAGNHGVSRNCALERHLRNVLCARIHTPQADSAHGAAGRAALGLA